MEIIGRGIWKARRARPRTPQSIKSVREFFIHWPAIGGKAGKMTQSQERATMRGIQAFHMDGRGWSDIGYSFVIFQSGRIYRGRGSRWVPAAQIEHNTNTVACMCYIGPGEEPTRAMVQSIKALHSRLQNRAGHRLDVRAHGDVNSTECPGPALRRIARQL